jgi:hypothetical protein
MGRRRTMKARQADVKETKVSRTDPEAGYMVRDGKPKGFFSLDHRTVDAKLAIITDIHVTPANVHDSIVYLGRLDRQRERFDLDVRAVGLDAGFATVGIAKSKFVFDYQADGYRCPDGQLLTYATTDRNGNKRYTSDPAICRDCPLLPSCTSNTKAVRTITQHVWADARERTDAHRLTPWGKAVYKRRKETVERSFADAKQLYGHRYARFRGLVRVACQCLLAQTTPAGANNKPIRQKQKPAEKYRRVCQRSEPPMGGCSLFGREASNCPQCGSSILRGVHKN